MAQILSHQPAPEVSMVVVVAAVVNFSNRLRWKFHIPLLNFQRDEWEPCLISTTTTPFGFSCFFVAPVHLKARVLIDAPAAGGATSGENDPVNPRNMQSASSHRNNEALVFFLVALQRDINYCTFN